MRTTINIPEELINKAMRITGASTKTELIKTALMEIIQKNKILKLKNYKGKINLKVDLNSVRKRTKNIS